MQDDTKNPVQDKQKEKVVQNTASEPIKEAAEKPDLPASASEALQAGEIEAPAEEKLIEAVEKDGKTATSPSDKAPAASDAGKWYIVHTYSGHENKVARSLRQRIESMGFEDRIFDIIVPTRDTVKVSGGKKENVKEKIFPGYVLVKMILDDESWLLVRTTQGVTAFIGTGNKPTPISDKEVEVIQKIMATEQPLFKTAFTVGEAVKIVDGPFSDFLGAIDSIDEAKGKLKVLVSIFGRETPVELDFLQVTKL
ncbi:MAG: transcription termination/antitermination protein NusG [bacterium]|nr:transcription termination/antitermination protein NusG [bacterium]